MQRSNPLKTPSLSHRGKAKKAVAMKVRYILQHSEGSVVAIPLVLEIQKISLSDYPSIKSPIVKLKAADFLALTLLHLKKCVFFWCFCEVLARIHVAKLLNLEQ